MRKKTIRRIILFMFLSFWTIITLYPIIFMLINGLKSEAQFANNPWIMTFPVKFSRWAEVWNGGRIGIPLGRYFFNSIIVSAGSIVLITLVAVHCGYSLARFRFPGRKIMFALLIATLSIPVHAMLIPIFVMMGKLNLRNSYVGLIGVYTAFWFPFSAIIMRANFESFPQELLDAAKIDGFSEIGAFWRIVFPLSKGLISSLAIVTFIGTWSELLYAFVLMNRPEKRTLTVGLTSFKGEYLVEWTQIFAGLSIASLPIIIFFFLFQRNITKGMTLGSFR